MRTTLRQLRGLERELGQLTREIAEQDEISPGRQLALYQDALYDVGGPAEAKFLALAAEGRMNPLLARLFQLERAGPCVFPDDCHACDSDPTLCPEGSAEAKRKREANLKKEEQR